MKKTLGIVLSIPLLISLMASPSIAEVDTVTSASVVAEPASTATSSASASANEAIDTSNLPEGSVYTVESGDTFSGIAWAYGLSIDELAELNPHINDINWIYPGDQIIVKAAPAVAPEAPAAPAAPEAPAAPAKPTVDKAPYEKAQKEGFDWETKREEAYNYNMPHKDANGGYTNLTGKDWFEQMDFYEKNVFTGKTVAEVEDWFNKYADANGRPFKMAWLNDTKISAADKAAAEAASASFTATEKQMLVDVTTGATMSLQDPHSHFMDALKEASAAKKVIAGNSNLYLGIGNVSNYRIRTGSNDNLNVTTASVIFDKDGKIVDAEFDVQEITPSMFQWLPAQK